MDQDVLEDNRWTSAQASTQTDLLRTWRDSRRHYLRYAWDRNWMDKRGGFGMAPRRLDDLGADIAVAIHEHEGNHAVSDSHNDRAGDLWSIDTTSISQVGCMLTPPETRDFFASSVQASGA